MCIMTDHAILVCHNLIFDDLKPHRRQIFNVKLDGLCLLLRIAFPDVVRDFLIVDEDRINNGPPICSLSAFT